MSQALNEGRYLASLTRVPHSLVSERSQSKSMNLKDGRLSHVAEEEASRRYRREGSLVALEYTLSHSLI